jgi:hypothetical protein
LYFSYPARDAEGEFRLDVSTVQYANHVYEVSYKVQVRACKRKELKCGHTSMNADCQAHMAKARPCMSYFKLLFSHCPRRVIETLSNTAQIAETWNMPEIFVSRISICSSPLLDYSKAQRMVVYHRVCYENPSCPFPWAVPCVSRPFSPGVDLKVTGPFQNVQRRQIEEMGKSGREHHITVEDGKIETRIAGSVSPQMNEAPPRVDPEERAMGVRYSANSVPFRVALPFLVCLFFVNTSRKGKIHRISEAPEQPTEGPGPRRIARISPPYRSFDKKKSAQGAWKHYISACSRPKRQHIRLHAASCVGCRRLFWFSTYRLTWEFPGTPFPRGWQMSGRLDLAYSALGNLVLVAGRFIGLFLS